MSRCGGLGPRVRRSVGSGTVAPVLIGLPASLEVVVGIHGPAVDADNESHDHDRDDHDDEAHQVVEDHTAGRLVEETSEVQELALRSALAGDPVGCVVTGVVVDTPHHLRQ